MNPTIQAKLDKFFSQYRLIKYKKNEIIYRPGDIPDHVAYIKSGYVRLYIISEKGEELTIFLLKPFFYFTLNFALTDSENKYFFETISPVELWRAPKEDTLKFIKSDPEMMLEIIRNVLDGMNDLLVNIEYIITGNAKVKVAAMLYLFATRFGKKDGDHIIIEVTPTHYDIGGLLGMTRETVSKQMRELKKMQIVTKNGKHTVILDMEKLQEMLSI